AFRLESHNAASRFFQRFDQTTPAVVGSHSGIYAVARLVQLEYGGAGDCGSASSGASQHEGGSLQLYFEPRGLYSRERLDGGSLWNPAGVLPRSVCSPSDRFFAESRIASTC